jgi:hypothetical protein
MVLLSMPDIYLLVISHPDVGLFINKAKVYFFVVATQVFLPFQTGLPPTDE